MSIVTSWMRNLGEGADCHGFPSLSGPQPLCSHSSWLHPLCSDLCRLLDRLYHDRGSQRPFRIETTNVALKGGAAGHHRLPLPPSVAQDFAALFSQTTLPLVTVPLTLLKRATCVFSRLPRSLPLCVLPRIRIQTSQPRLALLPAPPTSPPTFHPSPSRPLCHSGALLASQIVPVVSIIVTILRPLYLSLSSETPSVSPASEDLPENSEVPAGPLTFRDPLPGPSRRHRHEGSPQPKSTLAYRVGLGQTVLDDMLPPIEEIESPVPESPRRVTRNTYFWNEEYYNDPRNNRERELNRLRPTMGVIINFPEPKPKTRRRWLRALRKFCCTSVEEEDE